MSSTSWSAVLRSVWRESRAAGGRLVFFVACLAIGVAAVVGVSSLVAAMNASLRGASRDLLAADLRVSARRPLPAELDAFFSAIPHERSDLRELGAMLRVPGEGESAESRLVELKVVEGGYPFYGTLLLEPATSIDALGPRGAFLSPELFEPLGLELGDTISIGGAEFDVRASVLDEPDRLDFAMTLGPRVFLSAEGLARTDLTGAQNRVRHRALYRLLEDPDRDALAQLAEDLEASLPDASYLTIATHTDAQPNVRSSLALVEDYLGLVALLSLLLGGIGVSQIVRAWLTGRAQSVAVMRSLGLRAAEVGAIYLGHVALLALIGCVAGGALGAVLPYVVRELAPELFQNDTARLFQPQALARGVGLGLLVAVAFSLPPLTAIWRVPPAAVLRAEAVPLAAPRRVRLLAGLVLAGGIYASAWIQGTDALVAAIFVAGLAVLALLLFAGARLAMRFAARAPRARLGPYVANGLAAIARPGSGTTGAIVALGLGVMVVVAMALIERELNHTLRNALPEDAPSVFLVDVQPEQWPGVEAELTDGAARSIDSVPVVMARLRVVDGTPVSELAGERDGDRRDAWVLTREQRLTWLSELPPDNELVAGSLWSDPARDEVSIEVEFAKDLGVDVGSTLELDVQGIPVQLVVTSLREVDWESFGINFFLVVEPGVLEGAPHFRIAAARMEPAAAEIALQGRLAERFPNVTMLRIRPILEKVAAVLERLSLGVRALGAFTILTGLVILGGAVGTTALRRGREAALLKTLGVTRAGVTRLFAFEYALCGAVAGTIGATGALVLAWGFLDRLLRLDPELSAWTVPLATLATALLAVVSGLLASLKPLRSRPLHTLRS